MDEGPNIIEQSLTQSESSPAFLFCQKFLLFQHGTAFSPTALLLWLELLLFFFGSSVKENASQCLKHSEISAKSTCVSCHKSNGDCFVIGDKTF